jgi:hypothetical protein
LKPLIFIPKVRDIPEVMDSYKKLEYDKLVIENHAEVEAYQMAKKYCQLGDYTHLVLCPDDLVIDYNSFMLLKDDIEKHFITNIAGICNFSERGSTKLACRGYDGQWLYEDDLPEDIFSSTFTGFACQWISADILDGLSFTGNCTGGRGCLDSVFAQEIINSGDTLWVDPKARFKHLSNTQRQELREWKKGRVKREKSIYML